MNSKTIEREEICIVVMSTIQECYNNHFLTHLAHSNPLNKIEYVWWQQKLSRIELMANVLFCPIML
jgi:hypothetical protein